MPMLLAINTSTLQFGLALMRSDGTVLAEHFMSRERGRYGTFMTALDFLFSASNTQPHDLTALSVALGPGSFTGLRVGLSAAKGICHALDIPIMGISSLEALASQLPLADLPVVPVLHSRKAELFAAQFVGENDHQLTRTKGDISLKAEELSKVFKEPALFIGNDFPNQGPLLRKALGPCAHLAPAHMWNLKASSVGFLGLIRLRSQDFDDLQAISPIYLRPPEIRPNPFPVLE
jgi:tRNA threonylcarbamoyladenosine biosynthesis protein TsaB